jgi:hypothetical protein
MPAHARVLLDFVGLLAFCTLADAREVHILDLGSSIRDEVSPQRAALYQIAIPAETRSISLELSGCPTDLRANNADGTANERVKAYASFTVAKPTVWDATWSIAWCEPRALVLERGHPGFEDHQPATLYVSVFAVVQARFTLAVLDPSAQHELKFGHLLSLVMQSSNAYHQATGREYRPEFSSGRETSEIAQGEDDGFGETGVVIDTLSVRIPVTAAAISIRVALMTNQTRAERCKVAALFSFTVANLTVLPASWGFELEADVGALELVIPRSSRAFCSAEPCTLTVQIRDREANHYRGGYSCDTYGVCKCFVLDHDEVGHRLEIRVSEAKASDGNDPAQHYGKFRLHANASGSTCAPGCEEQFVSDGVCHQACFTKACRHDGGDCVTPLKRTHNGLLSLPHVPLRGAPDAQGFVVVDPSRSEMELTPYCAVGCPTHWIGDGVCEDACFCAACGWDSSDCAHVRASSAVRGVRTTAEAMLAAADGAEPICEDREGIEACD